MPSWDDLVDDYASSVAGIERWLEGEGDLGEPPGAWLAPATPPVERPSPEQLARLAAVHDRDLALRTRLELRLGETARAIADDLRRTEVARLYRSDGRSR